MRTDKEFYIQAAKRSAKKEKKARENQFRDIIRDLSNGHLSNGHNGGNKNNDKPNSTAGWSIGGFLVGATLGSFFGPIGLLIGGCIGVGIMGVGASSENGKYVFDKEHNIHKCGCCYTRFYGDVCPKCNLPVSPS